MRLLLIPVLYLYVSLLIGFTFLVFPGINGNPYSMFPDMVFGRASRPFVYRALMPSAIRLAAAIISEPARQKIITKARHDPILSVAVPLLRWEWEYLPEYGIASVLVTGCFLGYAFLLRSLVLRFFACPDWISQVVPVIGMLIVPAFYRYYNYIYDPCTLLTFTAALSCLAAGRTGMWYLCLAFAAINKETSILLPGLFFLYNAGSMKRRSLALHLALQIALLAVVKALISYAYRGNPGSFLEFHLIDHTVAYLGHPGRLIGFLAFAALWAGLLAPGWRLSPRFLQKGLFVVLGPLVGMALVFGFVDETRGYYEAVPFLVLLMVPTIKVALGGGEKERDGE